MGGTRIDPIEHQAMEMWREIQRRPETLNERNRRTVSCAYAMVTARAATLVREQRAKKHAQYLAREPRVPGTPVPERIRQRQHPLADRDFRYDAVDETGGGIGHSAPATRGAEPSALTRECDQTIVAAAIAVYPDETSGEQAAVEVGTQLALYEPRDGCTLLTSPVEERLELLPDDFVEQRLLRLVALVLCHADPAGTGWKCGGQAEGIVEPIAGARRRSPATAESGQDEPPEQTRTVGYTSAQPTFAIYSKVHTGHMVYRLFRRHR